MSVSYLQCLYEAELTGHRLSKLLACPIYPLTPGEEFVLTRWNRCFQTLSSFASTRIVADVMLTEHRLWWSRYDKRYDNTSGTNCSMRQPFVSIGGCKADVGDMARCFRLPLGPPIALENLRRAISERTTVLRMQVTQAVKRGYAISAVPALVSSMLAPNRAMFMVWRPQGAAIAMPAMAGEMKWRQKLLTAATKTYQGRAPAGLLQC